MKKSLDVAVLICGLAMTVGVTSLTLAADSDPSQIARGKYLAERVAMCGDCHTPFTPKGEPDRSKALWGAPLTFKPSQPVPGWVETAPPIAGLLELDCHGEVHANRSQA